MKTLRYFLIMLFFVPGLALAQDSLRIDIGGVENALAFESNFGFDIIGDVGEVVVGPSQFVIVESDGDTAPDNPEFGCDPYTAANAAEVAGNVALIARGGCAFVTKVQNAVAAGAIAAVIYVSDPTSGCGADECGEDGIVFMGGDCTVDGEPPEGGCSIPAVSTSLSTGQDIILEIKFEEEGTITCEVCTEQAPPPPPSTVGVHNVGDLTMSVYDYGFIGANASFGQEGDGVPVAFGDEEGTLFVSSVLLGVGGVVNTNPYTQAPPEFVNATPVAPIAPPFPAPYADYDQGFETSYTSDELGVLVTQRSYSQDGAAHIVVDLEIENTSGADINDAYVGIFADWDTGTTTSNDDNAGVNEDLKLTYVFDDAESSSYYGVAALGDVTFSGYNTDATTADDAQLFEALTTAIEPGADPAERAAVTGAGPFNIAAGAAISVQFAYVAGATEADLFANVPELVVSAEASAPEGTYVLGSAYPNPVTSRAMIGFELPTAQDVTMKVYDVLGREVAVLIDGMRQAGPQSVEFDTSALPSGVYVYRLEAGATQLTERMTIVR